MIIFTLAAANAAEVEAQDSKAKLIKGVMQAVDDTLYSAFGQRQISTIYGQANQYRVVLEIEPAIAGDPAIIGQLRVPGSSSVTNNGTTTTTTSQVPLAEIATIARVPAPLTVTRQDQFRAVTLSFNLAAEVSLGEAVAI